jgi:broad specificity phosphatase PhoE
MKIYLVRHGCTDECQKNIKQRLDSPLNVLGVEQIKKINVKTDIIYVSPSRRTIESAKLINPNARVIVDNRLYNKKRDLEHYSNELHSFLDEIRELNYNEVMIVTHGRIIKMIYSILEFNYIDTNFTDALSMEYGSISTIENNKMIDFNYIQ